jgi:mono/diheme cytochrome c family protein
MDWRRKVRSIGAIGAVAAGLLAIAARAASLAQLVSGNDDIDFVRDIRPILQNNCYQCHGPQKQKGLLRWDSRESVILHGGQSGPEIVPGKSADSRVINRVLGLGGEDRMPLNQPPLNPHEIDLLAKWIDQGAKWPVSASVANAKIERHWAYVKPVRPALPAVKDKPWCRNPIDSFVLAKLEQQGMHPSPEADRATLIRRVSLDLTGLPPTIQQVDDFVNDKSPDAYEKVVDRLLASPHFGERAAIRWLDLARYADSNGYEKDRRRSMWPYRDWVINALNADMPFSEFTIEQIAGDLLPHATLDQKIATGFNRNTMLNEEGGVDPEEYRYYANVDRVDTTATVWLGTTLRCAQCHNHKYDPFTQRDYYTFMAYFNSAAAETATHGVSDPTDVSTKATVQTPELIALQRNLDSLQAQFDRDTPELAAAQDKWEARQHVGRWKAVDVVEAKSAGGAFLKRLPDGSFLATGANPANDTYTIICKTDLAKVTGIRLDALADKNLPKRGPGRGSSGNFILSHVEVSTAPAGETGDSQPVALTHPSADFTQAQFAIAGVIADKPDQTRGWAVAPEFGKAHAAVFETAQDVGFAGGTTLTITLSHQSREFPDHNLGRFRIWVTDSHRPLRASTLPENIATILAKPRDQRDGDEKKLLAMYYRSIAPELNSLRGKLAQARKEFDEYPKTSLVMQELPEPRGSFMHLRGAFLSLGEKVVPGTPALFREEIRQPVRDSQKVRNRLDLARWLVSSDNPLTARVTVNRIWEQYFGIGIVATSEDFGTQGERPVNQPLLDWLAVEFMHPSSSGAKPWSMKAIHKLIVMSAAYRQSSDVTPELMEKDPYNRLLARGPRFRLAAELIRDQVLAVSGLLSEKMGGPSVFPLQPEGIWHSPYSGDRWVTSGGEDRYRRGVYTFIRRSAPYPEFMAFDMTTHESICTRRSRTDTALQALTTLNDPAFVQPAAALARRIITEGGDTNESRATFAFRAVLARMPEPKELDRLISLHDQMLEKYQSDPKAAKELATSGLSAPPDEGDIPQLAAWTVVSNVLLNLDETLTKE